MKEGKGVILIVFFVCIFFSSVFVSQCTYKSQSVSQGANRVYNLKRPEYHIMKKGETLWRLSKMFDVPLDDIIRYNNIDDVTNIPVGTKIFFPSFEAKRREIIPQFKWPLKGRIYRGFETKETFHHSGIDILAPEDTEILAAASGRVVYSGNRMAGYGNILIIKHSAGFSTVYAHNKTNLVETGQQVVQGQVIAHVGNTGQADGAHLHFEIRKNEKPVDPILFLPK